MTTRPRARGGAPRPPCRRSSERSPKGACRPCPFDAREGAHAPDNIDTLSSAVSIDTHSAVAPIPSIGAPARAQTRTRWWVEALAIVWLCWVYDATTNLAPLRLRLALGNA